MIKPSRIFNLSTKDSAPVASRLHRAAAIFFTLFILSLSLFILTFPKPALASSSRITGVSVKLTEGIVLRFRVSLAEELSSPELRVTLNDDSSLLTSFTEENDELVFDYYGVTPQRIKDEVTAELFALSSLGEKTLLDSKVCSVKGYCEQLKTREKPSSVSLKQELALKYLATDILKYGRAAEGLVFGEQAANWDISDEDVFSSAYAGENILASKRAVQSSEVTWLSAGVSFASEIRIYFKARLKKNEGATYDCILNNDLEVNSILVQEESGDYLTLKIYSEGIPATMLGDELVARITRNGEPYGGECGYNVNSCIRNGIDNPAYERFAYSLFSYGKSATLYSNVDSASPTLYGDLSSGFSQRFGIKAYEYSFDYPELSPERYSIRVTDYSSAKCVYVLKENDPLNAFGSFVSPETTIPAYLVIDGKGYSSSELLSLSTATNGKAEAEYSTANGLTVTLNGFNSTLPLEAYSPKGVTINVTESSSVGDILSPLKLSLSGQSLCCSKFEVGEGLISNSGLTVDTGEQTGAGYALKGVVSSKNGYISVTTGLDGGILALNGSSIGDAFVKAKKTAIYSDGSLTLTGDVSLEAEVGVEVLDRLSVSNSEKLVAVTASATGITATRISLKGRIRIVTDVTGIKLNSSEDASSRLSSGEISVSGGKKSSSAMDLSSYLGSIEIREACSITVSGRFKHAVSISSLATFDYNSGAENLSFNDVPWYNSDSAVYFS